MTENHKYLVELWNRKTKYPREDFIELQTFAQALNFLEDNGWFDLYEEG